MSNNIKEDIKLFGKLMINFLNEEKKNSPENFYSPKILEKKIDFSLTKEPISNEDFIRLCEKVFYYTPKTSSKFFFNQLFGGRQSRSYLGELIAVMLNNSMATFKIAGPHVLIEKEIIKKSCELINYKTGFGGTFPTGGSMSNFMSLIMARDRYDVEAKKKGRLRKMIVYTSVNSHYSIPKNVSFAGLGTDNIRFIKCDENGKMNIKKLEEAIVNDLKNGLFPFYVNATAGTTVLGSFDDTNKISKVCKKYKLWLHVDGALGGKVIFSKKYRKLIKGVSSSDSFCYNAHKTLGAPISCSVLLVKDKSNLEKSFNYSADYLYQTDSHEHNLGQTSFECGRRNNSFKLWTLWKSIGTKGIEEIVNKEFNVAKTARNYILRNKKYTVYSKEESLSICFNYLDVDPIDLCTKLYENNILIVSYGVSKGKTFVRLVSINPSNKPNDILIFFKKLEDFVDKNYKTLKKI